MTTLLTTCRRSAALRVASLLILLPSLVLLPSANIQANPENGVVVAGLAEIGEGLDGHLTIHQGSDRAIINWEAFSIAEGELTQFLQPGASSAILNRVIADNPSVLNGAIQANGNVFLINPAGIMVGPGGTIDVNGFVASTLDIPDASFMSGGDLIFSGSSENGVSNFGRISAVGGDVFLIGKSVNNAGSITAPEGTVGLAAGSEVLITAQPNAGGERVFVRPGPGAGAGNGVVNSGTIEGAAVELKAHGNMYAMAINNSGTVRATGSSSGGGGKVWLTAPGGQISNSGSIRASLPSGAGGSIFMNAGKGGVLTAGGEINANGVGSGSKGGNVVLLGEEISVPGGTSISANGDGGGGTIIIGGGANPQTDDEDEANSGGTVESSTINIAAGSSISANGANGPGGIVVIAGSDTSAVSVGGSVSATGGGGSDGGAIFVGGGDVTVTETSVIDASGGVNGGVITIQGETSATVNGGVRAVGGSGDGGVILIEGGDSASVGPNAVIDASGGTNGGIITVNSPDGTTEFHGTALAVGGSGDGGQITVTGDQGVSVGNNALLDASGGASGGIIVVDGMNGVTDFNGTARANGGSGTGGQIQVTGDEVNLNSTSALDADGGSGGGQIDAGGGFQGRDASISNATNTTVGNGATLSADALISGTGGQIVVWADNDTLFEGMISARGITGGGLVEVSGKERLGFDGTVSTLAADGTAGVLLLDPRNGVISTAAHAPAGSPFIINRNTLQTALASNNVIVSTYDTTTGDAGNLSINDSVIWNSAFSLTGLAEGDIYVSRDVINRGAGNVNLVGGWNPAVAPLGIGDGSFYNVPSNVDMDTQIFSVPGSYGANNGSVYVGTRGDAVTGADTGVVVASRTGQTNVAGYDVNVWGGAVTGGINTGNRKYSQIGYDREDAGTAVADDVTGRIRVKATNNVDLTANKFAIGTIGYGGWGGQDHSGLVSYAHIGHGGDRGSVRGVNMSGDIIVEAGNNVTGNGGQTRENFAMIGHGGYDNATTGVNVVSGNITVTATAGDVAFTAGVGQGAFAMIGHGGYDHRVGDYSKSDIKVDAGGDVLFTGSSGGSTSSVIGFAQIGHGGYNASTNGVGSGHKGDIDVDADGKIEFRGGDNRDSYVQLGHGGRSTRSGTGGTGGGISGNIDVNAGTGISFVAGTLSNRATTNNDANDDGRQYAMLGHGGYDSDASGANTVVAGIGNSGDISVTTDSGDINFYGGSTGSGSTGDNEGRLLFALLGHGGPVSSGDHKGSIDVEATAGSINFKAGDAIDNSSDQYNYAQLGHGGQITSWGFGGADLRGDTSAASVSGGTDGIRVTAGNAVNFTGGDRLGAHPAGSSTNNNQNNNQNYAQLGSGGYNTDGNHDGSITVNAATVNFLGGGGTQNYAMLGHGGTGSKGDNSGDITVTTSGALGINFQAGQGAQTWTHLGHGGWDADAPTGNSGNISVTANGGGSIDFSAVSYDATDLDSDDSYTQLGHGGRATNGNHFGTIDVVTVGGGDINFTGGDFRAFAQLGHGGRDSIGNQGQDGASPDDEAASKITVNSSGGIDFAAGGNISSAWHTGREAYVQLGHGGFQARGDHIGEIDVTAEDSILFTGGVRAGVGGANTSGWRTYAQLGHGGWDADNPNPGDNAASLAIPGGGTYNFDGYGFVGADAYGPARFGPTAAQRLGNRGDITVESLSGAIVFTASDARENYTQIGHGGYVTDGDHSGNITVKSDVDRSAGAASLGTNFNGQAYAAGDILFDARGEEEAGVHNVQLGHGGYFASGGHTGHIVVEAGGNVDFIAGRDNSSAQMGHGGRNDYLLNFTRYGTQNGSNGHDNPGTEDRDQDSFRLTNDYNSYTQDLSVPFNTTVSNGYPGLNGGEPNDIRTNGNDRYFSGTHTGDITVNATGNVRFTGYTHPTFANVGGNGWVQIGHGGWRNAADPNSPNGDGHNGAITVNAGVDSLGDVITAGAGSQIIFESGMQNNSHAQIGHGGYESLGNHSGNIDVAAAAGIDFHARGGNPNADWGNYRAENSYVQIGHGGIAANYDPYLPRALESTFVSDGGDDALNLPGAPGSVFWEDALNNPYFANVVGWDGTNFATFGAGYDAWGNDPAKLATLTGQGALMPLTTFGQTNVDASTIRWIDHDNNAATPSIPIIPTNRGRWHHIGAPGAPSDGAGGWTLGNSGDITITAKTGDILLEGAKADRTANTGSRMSFNSYVQFGHGGYRTGGDHTGNIEVRAETGNVVLSAAQGTKNTDRSYAQIGLGGMESGGNMTGNVTVVAAGSVTGRAGTGSQDYVQIGNGGYDANWLHGRQTNSTGDQRAGVSASDRRGDDLFYLYNPGFARRSDVNPSYPNDVGGQPIDPSVFTRFSGDITVVGGTGVDFESSLTGGASYSQIGHAGWASQVHTDGKITVDTSGADPTNGGAALGAGGDVRFQTGRNDNYSQLGHGGRDAWGNQGDTGVLVAGNIDTAASKITVNSGGGVAFGSTQMTNQWGQSNRTYVQLGHGGFGARGDHVGDIEVTAVDTIMFTGGTGMESYAQLGNGGQETDGPGNNAAARGQGHLGKIDVTTTGGGDIIFIAGGTPGGTNGRRSYAQLGHGGWDTWGNHGEDPNRPGDTTVSAISVNSSGGITFQAGRAGSAGGGQEGFESYALLGFGGQGSRGDFVGDIAVVAVGDILFKGGIEASSTRNQVFVGHSGWDMDDPNGNTALGNRGYIHVASLNGDISLESGLGVDSPVLIGHGGRSTSGANTGDIFVRAGGDVTLDAVSAGAGAVRSYTQIGHGGYDSDGLHTGAIKVSSGTGSLQTGIFSDIGNFGALTFTDTSVDGVRLLAGVANEAQSQIGHGGFATTGNHNGEVVVIASKDIALTAGTGNNASAQIGHGGNGSPGNMSGAINVISTGGNLTLTGSTADHRYALIGHGTEHNATTGTRTGDIFVSIDGTTTISDTRSSIGHRTSTAGGVSNAQFTLISGALTSANESLTDMIVNNIGLGDVTLAITNGDLTFGTGAANYNSANNLNLLSTMNVNMLSSVQNSGTGTVNLAGGWDELTGLGAIDLTNCPPITGQHMTFSLIKAAPDSGPTGYGNNNGGVNIGTGAQTQNVFVGSAGGQTNALGYFVDVNGSNATGLVGTQLGFKTTAAAANATIMVDALAGGVTVTGGSQVGAEAQIGHGGISTNNSAAGAIMVDTTGNVMVSGGSGNGTAGQIGHGGTGSRGARSGQIDVTANGNVTVMGGSAQNAGALIGNGGRNASGNSSGDVTVTTDGSFAGNNDVTVMGGSGPDAYAQIGSGGTGSGAGGTITGDVTVMAPGTIALTGGSDFNTNAQIGLGGQNSSAILGGATQVTSVTAGEDVTITGGVSNLAFAQVGNGGRDANGVKSGTTNVTAGTDVTLLGGGGFLSYAQIGLGGAQANSSRNGAINVNAGDDVNLTRGSGPSAYAKIGHGDQLFSLPIGFGAKGTSDGDITVTAVDSLGSTGGMIGHVDVALGGATPGTGNTYIAVSRFDDPAVNDGTHGPDTGTGESNRDPLTGLESPSPGDGGNLVADATSVFSSAGAGELRLYIPTRSDNQIAGASLNGTVFAGAPTDPSPQLLNEFTVVRYPPGMDPLVHEDQHDNIVGGVTTGYDAASGFSFYYDALAGREQGYVPPPGSTSGGAGGGGEGGGAGVLPGGFGGAGSDLTPPRLVPVDPFLVFIDGVPFFGSNRLFDGSGRTFVGFFLFGLLDDRFDSDEPRDNADGEDEDDDYEEPIKGRRGPSETGYRPDNRPGVSSFDIFGGGGTQDAGYFQP